MLKYLLTKNITDELAWQYEKMIQQEKLGFSLFNKNREEKLLIKFLLKKLSLQEKNVAPQALVLPQPIISSNPKAWSEVHEYVVSDASKNKYLLHQNAFQKTFQMDENQYKQLFFNLFSLAKQQVTEDCAGKTGRIFCIKLIGILGMFFGEDRDTEYLYFFGMIKNASKIQAIKKYNPVLAWLWKALNKHKFF